MLKIFKKDIPLPLYIQLKNPLFPAHLIQNVRFAEELLFLVLPPGENGKEQHLLDVPDIPNVVI